MNTENKKLKGLSESRFGSMIFLLRMAGISLQMKKVSTIYAVYMITVVICSYSTFIGHYSMKSKKPQVYSKDHFGPTTFSSVCK